jgi:hypothetical protein
VGAGSCSGSIQYRLPAGGWGYKQQTCVQGHCFTNTTCENYEPGSKCGPVFDACGGVLAIACIPPVLGCQRPSDCSGGKTCQIDSGIALCL